MLISVIMPVYKVEDFVAKAIESVLSQTLSDFEFFAVDDGSPDESGEICDAYAKLDSRLRVIHQENRGAPAARNAALEMASGKYVYFIDSDDWIEPDMLQKMYDLAEQNRADLVVTGFCMEYYQNGKDITYKTACPDRVYPSIQAFRLDAHHYLNNSLLSLPWNKLFLLERIQKEKLRFRDTKWDDHHFCMDYFMNCENVVLSSMTEYHWYRSRKGSETMIHYSDIGMFQTRREHYRHILELYQHWGIQEKASMEAVASYYVGRLFQCVQELMDNAELNGEEKRQKIEEILVDPMTREALKRSRTRSNLMKILVWPMRIHNVSLCMCFGKSVSIVRRIAPGLFIRVKEREVHGA